MKKILTITGILPIAEIIKKKNENDIILEIENQLKEKYTDIVFQYVFTLPYTNRVLSMMSKKWSSYFKLQKIKKYSLKGRCIFILGIIQLPRKFFFRNLLYEFSLFLNKKYVDAIINEFKPTMIHAQNSDCDAYVAKRLSKKYGIPYVVTLRGLNTVSDSIVVSNLTHAKSLIALSQIQKIRAVQLTTNSIQFIPHGVANDFYKVKKIFENDIDRIKIVAVCRLIKLKNIDFVIKSLSIFDKNFVFDIYGDGPEKESLKNLIKKLDLMDKIVLKGTVSNFELSKILVDYDLFIMPSFPETLGRVYLEAMACGLPVIAAKNTGIDGIVTDGKEGFLIDLEEKRSLISVLDIIFNNPVILKEMSNNAKILSYEFAWENIADKLYSIYTNSTQLN